MYLFHFIFVSLTISVLTILFWYKFTYFWYKNCLKNFKEITSFPTNTTDLYNFLSTQPIDENTTKNCFKMYGPFPLFITSDEKLFSIILGSSKHINKPKQINIIGKIINDTLFFAKGDIWRHRRRLYNPFFDYGSVLSQFEMNSEHTNVLIANFDSKLSINDNELIDLDSIINEFIMGQISDSIMGMNLLEINPEVLDILGFFNQQTVRKALICTNPSKIGGLVKDLWVESKKWLVVKNCVKQVLEKRIKQNKNFDGKKMKFIDYLINDMNENKMSELHVIKELSLFLFAGYETTAHSISFTMYLLSKHPQIQENVFKEITTIITDVNQPVTYQDLKKMTYLDLIIKESLRMYTTGTFFFRILEEDVEFEGTTLPKGLSILLNNTGIHKDPELYPEPEKFIPERFLSDEFKSKKRFGYAPFCLGIRQCIGKRLAENTLKLTLAKILLNYKLFDAEHNLNLAIGIGLTSLNGIKVIIKKR